MSQTTIPELQARRRRGRTHAGRWRFPPQVVAVVAAGGALGAPARYAVGQLAPVESGRFPWATLSINLTGSLALGLLLALVLERFPPTRWLRPFLATGFLGAYTTYSTFAVESVMLVHDGHPATALVYNAASVLGGLLAVWVGLTVGRTIPLPIGGRS